MCLIFSFILMHKTIFSNLATTMNAFVILSVLVASCYAGYDKKHVGGPYPLPGNRQVALYLLILHIINV